MLGVLRDSINASMGRSELRGGGAKSTTGLAAVSFFCWGHQGARSLDASAKYSTAVTSWSPAVVGGDEEDIGAGSSDEGRGGRLVQL
jgi:hypothetical protein